LCTVSVGIYDAAVGTFFLISKDSSANDFESAKKVAQVGSDAKYLFFCIIISGGQVTFEK
jgi:hypothetical protein